MNGQSNRCKTELGTRVENQVRSINWTENGRVIRYDNLGTTHAEREE